MTIFGGKEYHSTVEIKNMLNGGEKELKEAYCKVFSHRNSETFYLTEVHQNLTNLAKNDKVTHIACKKENDPVVYYEYNVEDLIAFFNSLEELERTKYLTGYSSIELVEVEIPTKEESPEDNQEEPSEETA